MDRFARNAPREVIVNSGNYLQLVRMERRVLTVLPLALTRALSVQRGLFALMECEPSVELDGTPRLGLGSASRVLLAIIQSRMDQVLVDFAQQAHIA